MCSKRGGGSETLRGVDAQLHQVIATPVHAPRPLVVGGLVFGFPLDDAKMANLEEQTNTVTSLVDGNALESTGLGWTPSAGLSTSAGNAWIGEELRTLCIEATWSRPGRFLGSAHDWQVSAALFTGNDTAGALLAWRGWTVGDRLTGLRERIALPAPADLRARGRHPGASAVDQSVPRD